MQKNALGFQVWGLQKGQKIRGRKRAAVPPRGGGLNGVKNAGSDL